MEQFKNFHQCSSKSQLATLLSTIQFASLKHASQRRKDPEETPYINHPIGVAYILMNEGGVEDLETLQAAILHDTVEDTNTTLEELTQVFGKTVSDLVAECTDDMSLEKKVRKEMQVARAPTLSKKAKLVRLGDKIFNLRDLLRAMPVGWTEQRVKDYFLWSSRVVAGLRGTNAPLEKALDLLFKENL